MRVAAAVWLQLGPPPAPTLAQTLPEVPPLPKQERLTQRNDLVATLRVSKAQTIAGKLPELTLVLTNRGRGRLRVPNAGVNLTTSVRAFNADGEEMPSRVSAILEYTADPTRVRTLPALPPGGSREFTLRSDFNMPGVLPVGDYVFRVTYMNRAGWPKLYDVYERGAEEVWEGELTTSAAIRVDQVVTLGGTALTDGRLQLSVPIVKPLKSPPPPSPTVYPSDRFPSPPTAERLPEYVAAIIGSRWHSEYAKEELSGIARFGTHDTFKQLTTALSTAEDESNSAYVIDKALQALTFEDGVLSLADRAEELRQWDRWWQQHGRHSREQ
jgi:hypothetical protein